MDHVVTETPTVPRVQGGMGHTPVLAPRIMPSPPRVDPELLKALAGKYLPDLSDSVGPLYTMDGDIRPLTAPAGRIIGQALTVKTVPGDNLTVHTAFGLVQDGDVLVLDTRRTVGSCGSGAGSLALPVSRGLRGVVTDGSWRDLQELRNLEIPLYGRGVSPFSPPKRQLGEINVPVSCGGVVVMPGDIVVADEDGVVVIPSRALEVVVGSIPDYQPRLATDWPMEYLESRRGVIDAYVQSVIDDVRPDATADF
jgi:regulator of RNase E activity RraA